MAKIVICLAVCCLYFLAVQAQPGGLPQCQRRFQECLATEGNAPSKAVDHHNADCRGEFRFRPIVHCDLVLVVCDLSERGSSDLLTCPLVVRTLQRYSTRT